MDDSITIWLTALFWLYSTFCVMWLVQWWLGRHIQGLTLLLYGRPGPASTIYFYLLAPGVMLHELSHWLFAKLLFVPTGKLTLFSPPRPVKSKKQVGPVTLGNVEIGATDPVRHSLLGFAPLPMGVLALLVLAALLHFDTGFGQAVTQHDNVWQAIAALPSELLASLRDPVNIVWLYLVFSVSNGMLPSKTDRQPWLIGFFLPGSILFGLSLTGQLPPLPQNWQQALQHLLATLTWIFAFAAFINFLLAVGIFGLECLVSHLKHRRIVYR